MPTLTYKNKSASCKHGNILFASQNFKSVLHCIWQESLFRKSIHFRHSKYHFLVTITTVFELKRFAITLTLKNTDRDAFHEVGACPTHEHTSVAEVTVVNQKVAFELLFIGLSFSCDIDSIAPTTAARDYFDAIKEPINILRCAVLSPY